MNKHSRREFLNKLAGLSAGIVLSQHNTLGSARQSNFSAKVALEKANHYHYDYLKLKISDMIDKLGGLGDIVKPGDRVGIKINLTGGKDKAELSMSRYGLHAGETFWSNPMISRIVSELFKDAGARDIYLMEATYDGLDSFVYGGFDQVARYVGATLIDLNAKDPYDHWKTRVIDEYYRWSDWPLHGLLSDIDCFVSLPKMKQHVTAGVTHAMKNLIGITPLEIEKYSKGKSNRAGLHRDENDKASQDSLVKAIVDLNAVRPVDFSLVDGILTETGPEGTWGKQEFVPIQPGLLVAGKNAVAVDSVSTAVMGFDPDAEDYTQPFMSCLNYLRMADEERNLGPHNLSDIEIVGKDISEVIYNWTPLESATEISRKYGPLEIMPYAQFI